MRRVALWAYLAGVATVPALAYWSGPDAIVQCGLKLAAVQMRYIYDAVPDVSPARLDRELEARNPLAPIVKKQEARR